jgi:hypothetical protein
VEFVVNKQSEFGVQSFVRALAGMIASVVCCFLVSCSSSRTVGRDQVLPQGNHIAKTVMDSDFLIPAGAAMVVDYSTRSRYFVAEGGALSGFPKGVDLTSIYAEKGAIVPSLRGQEGFTLTTVDDANKIYQNRHRELPPAGMAFRNGPGGAVVVPVVGVGAGFWGWGPGWGWGWGRPSYPGRPISVRPSSYRIRQ